MLARLHLPPSLGLPPDLTTGKEREAIIGADALDDWTTRFIVQAAIPDAQRLTLNQDGRDEHVLINVEFCAWAALYQEEDGR
ncbi:hypothetical protein ABT272_31090 [Streptomyces sp900105245]|uniref:Uncharacterized protein n=1 Tax=Streptomyces sp. 900105245 TaxID=3154379 RepID=A0ABV1UEJ7_9ACTN